MSSFLSIARPSRTPRPGMALLATGNRVDPNEFVERFSLEDIIALGDVEFAGLRVDVESLPLGDGRLEVRQGRCRLLAEIALQLELSIFFGQHQDPCITPGQP